MATLSDIFRVVNVQPVEGHFKVEVPQQLIDKIIILQDIEF